MTPQEVIMGFTNKLSLTTNVSTSALDEAISFATNNFFNSLEDLKTKFLDDISLTNNAEEFLQRYCGIDLTNADTGAITGSDAGGAVTKTAASVVLEDGDVNDWSEQMPGSTITLSSGVKVVLPSTRKDGTAFTANDLFILKCVPKWLEAGISLNDESYGLSFSNTACDTIYVNLYNESDGALASCGPSGYYNSAGKGTRAYLSINLYYYSNLDVTNSDGKDLSSGQNYLDRTLAHEMNHAILAANVKQAYNLPAYITEGLAELVHGVDDTRDLLSFAGDANLMAQALTSSGWTDYPTVYSGGRKLNAPCYAGGFTLLRYMAKQASDNYSRVIYGTSGADNFSNSEDRVTIYGLDGGDVIENGNYSNTVRGGDYVLFDGGDGNNRLTNFGGNYVSLISGSGNDTIWDWYGNGTVDAGVNAYIFTGAGNDTIYVAGDGATADAGEGSDTITNNGGDNSSLNGGAGDDSLYSNANYVTLIGGLGNNTLTNNGGANALFVYGGGQDTLRGFRADSTLQGVGSYTKTTLANGNVSLKTSEGSVLIVGGSNLSTLNILGTEIVDTWQLNGTTATCGTVTVSGVKSVDGLSLNDKVVTVGASSLGKSKVTISDGYTLKLASDVSAVKSVSAAYDSSTQTYTSKGKSAGYTLSDNAINYTAATTKSVKFSGAASTAKASSFSLSGKTIKVGKSAVKTDGTPIKVLTSGYTLKFGSSISAPKSAAATYDATTQTYTTAGKTAGYKLSNNAISYIAATTKSFEFDGVASTATKSSFSISGKTIKVGKSAIKTDGTPLELLTDGYTLKLGKNLSAPEDLMTYSGGVYSYGMQTAGYLLDDTSITYSEESSDPTLELRGVASKPANPVDGVLTLKAANFSANLSVQVNDGYVLSVASGTYSGKTLTATDSGDVILSAGKKLKIDAGAGNDSVKTSGANSTILGGAGSDTLLGSTGADYLSGGSGDDSLWGGKGSDTLFGGEGSDTFVYRPNTGTDKIMDFTSDDLLQIVKADGTQGTFSNSTFSDGKLTLNITGGGKVIFNNVSASDSFNINGTVHRFNA